MDPPSTAEWTWLQPVLDGTRTVEREFPVKKMDRKFELLKGPQTAIEGYLKMAKTLASMAPSPGQGT